MGTYEFRKKCSSMWMAKSASVTKRSARRRCRPPTNTLLRRPMKHGCAVRCLPSPESGSSEHRTTTPFLYLWLTLPYTLTLSNSSTFCFWVLCCNSHFFFLRHSFTILVPSNGWAPRVHGLGPSFTQITVLIGPMLFHTSFPYFFF